MFFSSLGIANAWIFWGDRVEVQYCNDSECWLTEGINLVSWSLSDSWIVTNGTASEYIQKVVAYLLGFLYVIGVIIIIYAWFNMLTASWDEEKFKKSKTIIIYVIIWFVIMYLAGAIVRFILATFNQS